MSVKIAVSGPTRAKIEDIPHMHAIWRAVFRDKDEVIAHFLQPDFAIRHGFVYNDSGLPAAMLMVLDSKLHKTGERGALGYIYACATLPEHRAKGYMRRLIAYAAEQCAHRYKSFALVPAEESLFEYYAGLGFDDFFYIDEAKFSFDALSRISVPGSDVFWPDTRDITVMRERFLQRRDHTVYEHGFADTALFMCREYGGVALAAVDGGNEGYLVAKKENDTVTATEIIADKQTFCLLAGRLLEKLPAKEYIFRAPAGCGLFGGRAAAKRFAMLKAYAAEAAGDTGGEARPYFGLALD